MWQYTLLTAPFNFQVCCAIFSNVAYIFIVEKYVYPVYRQRRIIGCGVLSSTVDTGSDADDIQ